MEAVRLQLGVARLGEADLAGWWATKVLTRAGRYVLPRTFPRTWRPAAGQLLLMSAARWHEHAFHHRPTALHLYSDRLPVLGWTSAWLAEQKTAVSPDPLFDQLLGWATADRARSMITTWADGVTPRTEAVGEQLRLGSLSEAQLIDEDQVLQVARELAASYLRSDDRLATPYFDLTR
jgi:hypothetical protein